MIDDKKLYKAIGKAIKTLRLKEELNQNDFAKKIGLERTSITNIETGKQNTTVSTLFRICESFEIDDISALLPHISSVRINNTEKISDEKELKTGDSIVKVGSKTYDAIQRRRNS